MGRKKKKKTKEVLEKLIVVEERPKEVINSILEEDKVIVFEKFDQVYEPGYYGKVLDNRLELALIESCLLLKRGRIHVFKEKTFSKMLKA